MSLSETPSSSPGGRGAPTAQAVAAGPEPHRIDAAAVGLMAVLCATWSLQQVSLKSIADEMHPMLTVGLRSLLALGLLGALMRHRGVRLARQRWTMGGVAGGLFAVEFLLVSQALRWTQASHVVVFLYAAPVFAALGLHARLPGERLAPWQWLGILLAFGGIALAFLGGVHGGAVSALSLAGDACALLAAVAWGATTVVIRCSALAQAPATETLAYQLLGAAALLLPVGALLGLDWPAPTARVLGHLAFQSVVVSFASFLAWFWMLGRYPASQLGVYTFLTPLFGVLLSAWLLGEALRPDFVAGSGLVLAGIALVNGATRRSGQGA